MPPQKPDVDWSLRRSYCVTWLVVTIGLSLLYAILRYNVFKGVEWIHLPLYVVNKAVALSAVVLLSSSYLVGKWIKVWDGDPMKRMVLTKFLGLAGFALAALHIIMSLILLNPAYFAKFFGDGKLNLTGELTMLFGALSILFLASPAVSSLPNMKEELGMRRWKRSQQTGYIALQLNSLHLLAMGWEGWIDVSTWPGGVPPITMVAFVIGILPVVARYTSGNRSQFMTHLGSVSLLAALFSTLLLAQPAPITTIPVEVDFARQLQPWDGFGFNYVETAQTRDYAASPQDYGGFSLLSGDQKREIAGLVFGPDGLDVDILKMFLDPWHQPSPDAPFDHLNTTRHMLGFAEAGVRLRADQGDELSVITTLYGPPAWSTQQKFIGGRDLDPAQSANLINYVLDWAEFLRGRGIAVRYISPHNEGEDFYRWTFDEGKQRLPKFDYNAYWRPAEVNRFIRDASAEIRRRGLTDLQVTNGEPSNWTRFYHWGYADALRADEAALGSLGLITTHGFINGDASKMSYGTAQSLTTDLLRQARPELKAWITSMSWDKMDTRFVRMIHEHIYSARANAVIPWAGVQHAASWVDGDPNPGTAIRVHSDGRYELTNGYYFYKQFTTAGHRGMAVAYSTASNPLVHVAAFASAGNPHPDAFVVSSSIAIWSLPLRIRISGSDAKRFRAFRTTEDGREQYQDAGVFEVTGGAIVYDPPTGSTSTFIAVR